MTKKVSSDAFTRIKNGQVKKINGKKHVLMNKWMIQLDECPWCGSNKTFHKERMKTLEKHFQATGRAYDNVIDTSRQGEAGNTHVFMKKDLCLECGRDWTMQVFCWEKIEGKQTFFDFSTGDTYKKKVSKKDLGMVPE